MVHSFGNFVAICVELKDPMRFEKPSARLEADNQVRRRYVTRYCCSAFAL